MREEDAQKLVEAVRSKFPDVPPVRGHPWEAPPAIKIIDCVLSLNRPYLKVVQPRVLAFRERFPNVDSCTDLRSLIGQHAAPEAFLADTLNVRDRRRAEMLSGVTAYVIDMQYRHEGSAEEARMQAWATRARPGDYLAVGVPGFGLAGFQYLRMLFGAQTVKPDVHIVNYVSTILGRTVSDVHALYTFERAAEIADLRLRDLDAAIWTWSVGR